jgi:hypothetical protein
MGVVDAGADWLCPMSGSFTVGVGPARPGVGGLGWCAIGVVLLAVRAGEKRKTLELDHAVTPEARRRLE